MLLYESIRILAISYGNYSRCQFISKELLCISGQNRIRI